MVKASVVIFGTSISSAYLSGATIWFRAMSETFVNKGWHVTFIEEFKTHIDYDAQNKGIEVKSYSNRTDLNKILNEVFTNKIVIVIKFSGASTFQDRYIDEWLTERRASIHEKFILIYADADAPMRLPYIVNHTQFYFHKNISLFDAVWVMIGGQRAVDEYLQIGAKKAWYLPIGITLENNKPLNGSTHYVADIMFLGNPTYGRDRKVQELFFDIAKKNEDFRFLLAGAEWDVKDMPQNMTYLGYVSSSKLSELYKSVRFVLNLTREEMAEYGGAAASRLFEAAICGSCILTDYWPGLEKLFVPGNEIIIINNAAQIENCLHSISISQGIEIGNRAHLRVQNEHTAEHRIDQLLLLMSQMNFFSDDFYTQKK